MFWRSCEGRRREVIPSMDAIGEIHVFECIGVGFFEESLERKKEEGISMKEKDDI
jgi:hypothetical protein